VFRGRTLDEVKEIFAKRLDDSLFVEIADVAIEANGLVGGDQRARVWLGYELAVDSRYLADYWR